MSVKIVQDQVKQFRPLRQAGEAYPNDFRKDCTAGELHSRFGDSDAPELEAVDEVFTVAGRMMAKRVMGKIAFVRLQDRSGAIQLMIQRDSLPAGVFQAFKHWDVGDIVGARGRIVRTQKGELSIRASELRLLVKSLRPLPEKYHGLTDTELRYRQRYVDLIMNENSRNVFRIRSRITTFIRGFMEAPGRDFLEVETPMLHPIPGGATARPFVTHHNALDLEMYLRVAPELYLKRLIVGGPGRAYEINRNFRNETLSTRHNPEFTMLEWYRSGMDYLDLADEVIDLIRACSAGACDGWEASRRGYRELFMECVGLDPYQCSETELAQCAAERGIASGPLDQSQWLDLLFAEVVQPGLPGEAFTIVHDFLPEQAALARIRPGDPPVAERFEVFMGQMELANGYQELTDPDEQLRRFERENRIRELRGDAAAPIDTRLIAALRHGLPECSGVALGVDRMLMSILKLERIGAVLAFDASRA